MIWQLAVAALILWRLPSAYSGWKAVLERVRRMRTAHTDRDA